MEASLNLTKAKGFDSMGRDGSLIFRTCLLILSGVATAASAETDLSNPQHAVETWIRLKSDLTGRTTYEWMTGTVYGLPEDAASRPLFMVESVTVRETRKADDGSYEERNFACRLYKDAKTGAFIDRFDNPFTGRTVNFNVSCNPGIPLRLSPSGLEIPPDIPYESSALNSPMELQKIDAGDHIILRHDAHATFVVPSTGEVRPEMSIDTFKLAAEDLANPELTALFPAYSWVSNTKWMSIFGMQDVPGHMIWDLQGRKFTDPDELPELFRAALEELEPGILSQSIDWSN